MEKFAVEKYKNLNSFNSKYFWEDHAMLRLKQQKVVCKVQEWLIGELNKLSSQIQKRISFLL